MVKKKETPTLNKKLKVVLTNSYKYEGVLLSETKDELVLQTQNDTKLTLRKDSILVVEEIDEEKEKEKANRIFRLLSYYYDNKIPVHFNSRFGFRNGLILFLNEKRVLVQDKKYLNSIDLLYIEEKSIAEFRKIEDFGGLREVKNGN